MNALAVEFSRADPGRTPGVCALYFPGFEARSFEPRWSAEVDATTNSVIVHADHDLIERLVKLVERIDDPSRVPRWDPRSRD